MCISNRFEREAEEWLELGRTHFKIVVPLQEATRDQRIALAWALHRKTNQPQAWIAEKLGLCSAANVSQQVRRFQKSVAQENETLDKNGALGKWVDLVGGS